MKKYILLFLFIFLFSYFFPLPALAAECPPEKAGCRSGTSGCIGDICCYDVPQIYEYCIENIDWGYCGGNYTYPNIGQPTNCSDFWSNACCCDGIASLNCNVPSAGNGNYRNLTGSCERNYAKIDCYGIVGSHTVCNSTYNYRGFDTDTPPKCVIMKPIINSYSISKSSVILHDNFSLTVNSNCPNGLPGKCLIECKIVNSDGYFIYIGSWDKSGFVVLPNITCDKTGNYIVDYCGVYTDFSSNNGWGSQDDTKTTISCMLNPEFEPPTYIQSNDDSEGSVTEGTIVNLYVKWQDNIGLGKSLVRTNITGSWQNYTSCSLSGNSDWCNKTIDTLGFSGKICWNQWANDTSGNENNTMPENADCFNVIGLLDNKPPTYTNDNDNSGGSVVEGLIVVARTLWNDNKNLSSVSIAHNETVEWIINSSPLSETSQWHSFNINTSGCKGKKVCWYQNATDNSGNENNTMRYHIHCFDVISSAEATMGNSAEAALESIRKSISSSSAEFSLKIITLAFELLGIIVLVILLVIVVFQLVQSHG